MFHTQIRTSGNLQIYFAKITWLMVHLQSFIFSEEMLHKFECSGLTILLLYYLSKGKAFLPSQDNILSYCLSAKTVCFQCIEFTKHYYFMPFQIIKKKNTINGDYIAVICIFSRITCKLQHLYFLPCKTRHCWL